jgi:hypothetical protein
VSQPLNLARRPLRNERLPTLLLSLACVALAALTVRHATVAWELRDGGARDVAGQVVSYEHEIEVLGEEAATIGRTAPSRQQLAEWQRVKDLVDHRVFSWTGLFAALETALPPNVRLQSVAPAAGGSGGEGGGGGGGMELALTAMGKDYDDGVALLRALQGDSRFREARLLTMGTVEKGVTIGCTVRYVGSPARGGR